MWRTSLERAQKAVTMREMGRRYHSTGRRAEMSGQALFSKPSDYLHQGDEATNRDQPVTQSQVALRLDIDEAPGDERDAVILVAENEANNRRLIEHILGIAGYRYVSATNGLEVLQILDTCRVDVILLDLSMPLLDGYQTTERIRRRPDGAKLPIVAVTAYAMSEDRERALRSGCTDYLAKPFRASDLLDVVRRMLSSR
jgi:CheY-like chemotaxis protein